MRRWRTGAALVLALAAGCGRSPVVLFTHGAAAEDEDDDARPAARCGMLADDFFAQVVVAYDPTAGGGEVPRREDVIDPEAALGPPDYSTTPPLGTVSIGDGGTLTLGFEPCVMGTDGTPAPDLIVHEAGFDEHVTVELRPTAAAREVLGTAVDPDGYLRIPTRPDPSGALDLDQPLAGVAVEGLRFDAVRIRDVMGQGLPTAATPGADIDALEIMVPLPES